MKKINPKRSKSSLSNSYTQSSSERSPDNIYLHENRYKKPKEAHLFLTNLLKKEKISSKTNLLDVGCAAGELIYNIKKHFPEIKITGIDELQSLLNKARRNTPEDIIYKKKNIYKKNAKLGKYDIIIASGIMGIFDNPEIVFNNLYKNLKTGGKIYIFSSFNPYPFNVYIKYDDFKKKKKILRSGYNFFSLDFVKNFFNKKNMNVKIFPFKIKKKLRKRKNLIRKWTMDVGKSRIMTNGLCVICNQYWLRISQS